MHHPPIPNLRLGTSSWSSEDWGGVFYPPRTPPASFLSEYAQQFDTVEVDSTFYRTPNASMVKNWRTCTSPEFIFAAKFPQVITHEVVDREGEMESWIRVIRQLRKRGLRILGFFNNHYAGFAPGSIELFHYVWKRLPPEASD